MAGKVTYVMNQFAMMDLDAEIMEPASNILMMIPRTFVSVKLDGKETPVTDVYLTGNAHNQTTAFLPVSIQMTVFAQHLG